MDELPEGAHESFFPGRESPEDFGARMAGQIAPRVNLENGLGPWESLRKCNRSREDLGHAIYPFIRIFTPLPVPVLDSLLISFPSDFLAVLPPISPLPCRRFLTPVLPMLFFTTTDLPPVFA